jgi:hypothetical protein
MYLPEEEYQKPLQQNYTTISITEIKYQLPLRRSYQTIYHQDNKYYQLPLSK